MTAPRIAFVGSVNTSRTALESILHHASNLVGVLELSESAARGVSGYAKLRDLAEQAGAPCLEFAKVNAPDVLNAVREWRPDLLFVVGLSQLVGDELLAMPRLGCVGFHPTLLPAGRGRAPIAWLALGESRGAATFFLMDAGADSGPILVQEPFEVSPDEYAFDIEESVHQSIRRALGRWLPELNGGEWNPQAQDHTLATYLGKRTPADGHIDWRRPASEIAQLVRAASRPFPGAYTYLVDAKLTVWQATIVEKPNILGVPGRVLDMAGDLPLVQTASGALRLDQYEFANNATTGTKLRVGSQLGYATEDEICRLRKRVAKLEQQLSELMDRMPRT